MGSTMGASLYGAWGWMSAVGEAAGIRNLNEISSIGNRQNRLLGNIFEGNEEAYTTSSLIIDVLSMGFVQLGTDNARLDRNREYPETNIEEKARWVNEEAESGELEGNIVYKENWEAYFKETYGEENVSREISGLEVEENSNLVDEIDYASPLSLQLG